MAASLINYHLNNQDYTMNAHRVDPNMVSNKEILSIFIDALDGQDIWLLINYYQAGIMQGPMGHGKFSPFGAYNHNKDSFLVMDVAKYKYPPFGLPPKGWWVVFLVSININYFTIPNIPEKYHPIRKRQNRLDALYNTNNTSVLPKM